MDYVEKIENGELFVLCVNEVRYDLGINCIIGYEYEVLEYLEEDSKEFFIIETEIEDEEMKIFVNDPDFKIIYK